jgi:hypothetical protein
MAPGKRTGYASLPLHGGKAPPWLFSRMVLLSREILAHRIRLAFERRDYHGDRGRQGVAEGNGTRVGPVRRWRKGGSRDPGALVDRSERIHALKRLAAFEGRQV